MQIVYFSILLATVASVLCAPKSTLLSNLVENSGEPSSFSLSDSASSSNDLPSVRPSSPSPLPSFSQPADEIDTLSTDIPSPDAEESCDNPPCNVIVIQMDEDHNRTDVQKSVDEAFGDRVVRWMVVAKTTHIDKTEEISDDFLTGKKKKVSSENRFEQLQVMRDSRHAFFGNEFDLVSVFK